MLFRKNVCFSLLAATTLLALIAGGMVLAQQIPAENEPVPPPEPLREVDTADDVPAGGLEAPADTPVESPKAIPPGLPTPPTTGAARPARQPIDPTPGPTLPEPPAETAPRQYTEPSATAGRRAPPSGYSVGRYGSSRQTPRGGDYGSSSGAYYGGGPPTRGFYYSETSPQLSHFRLTPTQADPEMAALLKADEEAARDTMNVVQDYRRAKNAEERNKVRSALEPLVQKHFDVRQKRRELEITRLEAQLERVRAAVKKRSDNKEMIINRRISQILGEEDELAF